MNGFNALCDGDQMAGAEAEYGKGKRDSAAVPAYRFVCMSAPHLRQFCAIKTPSMPIVVGIFPQERQRDMMIPRDVPIAISGKPTQLGAKRLVIRPISEIPYPSKRQLAGDINHLIGICCLKYT